MRHLVYGTGGGVAMTTTIVCVVTAFHPFVEKDPMLESMNRVRHIGKFSQNHEFVILLVAHYALGYLTPTRRSHK